MVEKSKVYEISFKINKAKRSLKRLDELLSRLGKETTDVGKKLENELGDKGKKAADKLGAAVKRADKKVEKLKVTAKQVGNSFQSVGKKMTMFFTAPIVAAGAASVKFALDINKGMATIATLMPGQTERVRELKKEIQDLSIETGIATDDLTAGAYSAVSAWGDSAVTIDKLRIVAKSAQAGLATTEETLGLLASVTEIYGDNTVEATEHLADFAFVANKLAIKAPFAEMASSMGNVAPLAKQIGIGQRELFATLTSVAGVTGSVSEVATQMSSLYTSVITETPQMSEIVTKTNKEMGESFKTAAEMIGKIGTLKFLEQIKKNTKTSKEFQKVLGGRKEGLILALSLLNSRSAKYTEALKEMTEKSGQMAIANKEITDGINKQGQKWEETKKRLVVFGQRLGDKLLPILERLSKQYLEPLLKHLESLDEATMKSYIEWGFWIATVGPTLVTVGKLVTSLAAMSKLMGGMAGITKTLTSAVGAGGLAGAFTTLTAAIAAFFAGFGVGELMNKYIFDPMTKKAEWTRSEVSEQTFDARQMASRKSPTTEAGLQKSISAGKKRLESLSAARAGLPYGPQSLEDVAGFVTSPFTDAEGPTTKVSRIKEEAQTAIEGLLKKVNADVTKWNEIQRSKKAGAGQAPNVIVQGSTFNVQGGVDKTTMREMKKELDKRDRKTAKDVRRAISGIGLVEQ